MIIILGKLFFIFFQICILHGCIVSKIPDENQYLMRNFDFKIGKVAKIYYQPRNISKKSFHVYEKDVPVEWISKYNTITVSLFHPNYPQDIFNDQGLVGHVLVLRNQIFNRNYNNYHMQKTVTEMDILQYIGDTCKDIKEVYELFFHNQKTLIKLRKVTNVYAPIDEGGGELNFHWVVCDKSGDCGHIYFDNSNGFQFEFFPKEESVLIVNHIPSSLQKELDLNFQIDHLLDDRYITKGSFGRMMNMRYFHKHSIINQTVSNYFNVLDYCTFSSWNKWQTITDLKSKTFYFKSKASLEIFHYSFNDGASEFSEIMVKGLDPQEPFVPFVEKIEKIKSIFQDMVVLFGEDQQLAEYVFGNHQQSFEQFKKPQAIQITKRQDILKNYSKIKQLFIHIQQNLQYLLSLLRVALFH